MIYNITNPKFNTFGGKTMLSVYQAQLDYMVEKGYKFLEVFVKESGERFRAKVEDINVPTMSGKKDLEIWYDDNLKGRNSKLHNYDVQLFTRVVDYLDTVKENVENEENNYSIVRVNELSGNILQYGDFVTFVKD